MARNFEHTVVKVLREESLGNNYVARLQVIVWGNGEPVLERRVYHVTSDGCRPLKLKGFSEDDMQFIKGHFDDVLDLIGAACPGAVAEHGGERAKNEGN